MNEHLSARLRLVLGVIDFAFVGLLLIALFIGPPDVYGAIGFADWIEFFATPWIVADSILFGIGYLNRRDDPRHANRPPDPP